MKTILCSFAFFLLVALTIRTQGQNPRFANTYNGQSSVYGIVGTTVFKIDSVGNSIWVKDFTGFIAPSTYSNELISSAFDGKYLYVLEIQGVDNSSGPPHTYYPAVVKMDTTGNIIFIQQSSVMSGGSYHMIDIFPSLTNGVWILDDYSPGFTHIGNALQMDSLGHTGINLGFWYGSIASIRKMSLLPDSNYVLCANHRPSSPGSGFSFPALTKFDNSGTVIWRADYTIPGGNISDVLVEQALATDSSGNIYLMCDYYTSVVNAVAGIKISSNGNVLISKLFTDLQVNNVQSLHYENGELICSMNNLEIHFDTLFNNPCLTTVNIALTTGNNYQPNARLQQYSSAIFSPVNSLPITFVPQVPVNYCAVANTHEFAIDKIIFVIHPNPTKFKLKIRCNKSISFSIIITDVDGRVCIQNYLGEGSEVDISALKAGIYFVMIKHESGISFEKLTVL